MANQVFTTTPGAADPAIRAAVEAERNRRRQAGAALGVGRIRTEDELRAAQNLWAQSGKPMSGPLYNALMRVSMARNAAIRAGRPDPITNERNQKNVFLTPATRAAQAAQAAQQSAHAPVRPQPFAAQTQRTHRPDNFVNTDGGPIIVPGPRRDSDVIVDTGPRPTAFDQATPSQQSAAAISGNQSTQQPSGNPGTNTATQQQNYNTQIRSQQSGYSGNRRYHPFSGR